MNDSINKYLDKSKNNLNTIIEHLDNNIEFLENDLWNNYEDIKQIIKDIIEIYYDKYYLYNLKDYSKINKYIVINNKINRKLKTILMAIIDYYEGINEHAIIKSKESSILYLTILIYLAIVLNEKEFKTIENPKKIEKIINNIIDNFARIRFRKEKDLNKLINNIETIVKYNNEFNHLINTLDNKESHNSFISINNDDKYYKVIYEYDIEKLNDYEEIDIKIVNEKMNIDKTLTKISFTNAFYTMFKLLKQGKDYILLFPISKKNLLDDELRKSIISNNLVQKNIKFLVDYEDISGDYEFINLMKYEGIDIYIEINNSKETNNYNMFMDISNIIVPEDFISINEKYVEIWKDMNINFIIKNLNEKINEKNLISRK